MNAAALRLAPIPQPKAVKGHKQPKIIMGASVVKVEHVEGKASDLLQDNHPLHVRFIQWLNGKESTKRKAREFARMMHLR